VVLDRGWDIDSSAGIGWQQPEADLLRQFRHACEQADLPTPQAIIVQQPEWVCPWAWAERGPDLIAIDQRLVERLDADEAAAVLCIAWAQKLAGWERISWPNIGHAVSALAAFVVAILARSELPEQLAGWQWLFGLLAVFLLLDWPFLLVSLRGLPGRLRSARMVISMLGGGQRAIKVIQASRQALLDIPGGWRGRYGWGLSVELDRLHDAIASVAGLPPRTWWAWLSNRLGSRGCDHLPTPWPPP